MARSAAIVVVRAPGNTARTAGYCGNGDSSGGSGNEDDSKGNSGKNGECGGNNGGGASHLLLFLCGRAHDTVTRFVFCSIHNCHMMTQATVRQYT